METGISKTGEDVNPEGRDDDCNKDASQDTELERYARRLQRQWTVPNRISMDSRRQVRVDHSGSLCRRVESAIASRSIRRRLVRGNRIWPGAVGAVALWRAWGDIWFEMIRYVRLPWRRIGIESDLHGCSGEGYDITEKMNGWADVSTYLLRGVEAVCRLADGDSVLVCLHVGRLSEMLFHSPVAGVAVLPCGSARRKPIGRRRLRLTPTRAPEAKTLIPLFTSQCIKPSEVSAYP